MAKHTKFLWLGVTLIISMGFASLSVWQLERAEFKRAQQAAFASQSTTIHWYAGTPPAYAKVRLSGSWVSDAQVVLDSQSYKGDPGFAVITPVCCVEEKWVLVNRGWVPWRERSDVFKDLAPATEHAQTLQGRFVPLPARGLALGGDQSLNPDPPRLWHAPQIDDFKRLAERSGLDVHNGMVWLDPDGPDGFVRDWQLHSFGPERHVGYAVQWGAFALTAWGLFFVLVLRKKKTVGKKPL